MTAKNRKKLKDLIDIVKKLRSEAGCPWDRVQTHETLKPYLVEETYEALEAIEKKDYQKLSEELGDIFLHIIFHSELAREAGHFDIFDVIGKIWSKMIHRHPHVFGRKKFSTVEQVWKNWDHTKRKEEKDSSRHKLLKNLPAALPALYRAEKVQRRAARMGFDWNGVAGAWAKVKEEISELKKLIALHKNEKFKEEIGDLLFSVVNIARKLEIDGEEALRFSTEKFIQRFHYMEKLAESLGQKLEKIPLDEKEKLWQKSKKELAIGS